MRALILLSVLLWSSVAGAIEIKGAMTQGSLLRGQTEPGTELKMDGQTVRVDPQGRFVIGFNRSSALNHQLVAVKPDGSVETKLINLSERSYNIQRIDGLPPGKVTPPRTPEVQNRIAREFAQIKEARKRATPIDDVFEEFIWPAKGIISGVFGSQRILNGEPRNPHSGVDVAAPTGTPIVAPAGGVISLAEEDHYFTGGTVMLDHGHGVQSIMIHMSRIDVKVGQRVRQGDPIGAIGATGRATGPHLHWGISWFGARLDPALLVPPMPKPEKAQ